MAMRTMLLAFAATASLSMILTGCGGGGSSTTPTAAPASVPVPASSSSPPQEINNFTGPSSKVTISFKIPSKNTTPTQAQRTKLASLRATKGLSSHLRTLSNTSPSGALRALGQRQPTYITPNTYYVEFVLTDSNSVVQVDDTTYCYQNTCSMTFDAPIGSGFTGTLYLYDTSYVLVGAGSTGGISVSLGNTTTVPITVNGVVAFISIQSTSYGPFLDDPSGSAVFTVTPVAQDYDGNALTTPGVLIDSNFYQIGSVTLNVDTDTIPAAQQTLNPQGDLSFLGTSYTYQGLTAESSINFTATAVETGTGPVVPVLNTFESPYPTQPGNLQITINSTSLAWTNPNGYPNVSSDPLTNLGSIALPTPQTAATAEFPLATNAGTYTFGLVDTSTTFGGNITLTDNGLCTGIVGSYLPVLGTYSYASLSASPYFQITMGSSGATNTCVITASDGQNPAATLSIYTDQSSLLIQNKARKH